MSSFFMNEECVFVSPSLASLIGLSEAILLQKLETLISNSKDKEQACYSVPDLEKHLPFWSRNTIKSLIYHLQKSKFIFVEKNFNRGEIAECFYKINFAELERIIKISKITENDIQMI